MGKTQIKKIWRAESERSPQKKKGVPVRDKVVEDGREREREIHKFTISLLERGLVVPAAVGAAWG